MTTKHTTYDISISSLLKVIAVLIGLWFVFSIRDIIAIVFASIIVASALSPVIDYLAKRGIHRTVTILLAYIGIIAFLGITIYFIVPPALGQIRQLGEQLPNYFDYFNNFLSNLKEFGVQSNLIQSSPDNLNAISNFLNNLTSNLFDTTKGFISGFTALLTVFVLTLYLLLDEDGIKKFFTALLPVHQKSQLVSLGHKIGNGLGSWLRGQLLLAVIVGTLVYIGLSLLQIPYALTLGIVAGVFEIIPIVGPIISAIPAILIALSISPTMALIVTGFYVLVQEAENKILVPKVMQRTVGLHPVTIIIVLLIGAKLMGILGILLSVPVTSMVYIALKEWSTLTKTPALRTK